LSALTGSVLDDLFGPGVAVAEGPVSAHQGALVGAEEALAARMAPGRRAQFVAGRTLARAALGTLGAAPVAIGRAAGGSPVWPAGFVGTITHCGDGADGWCAAAVAPADRCRGLGLDAELDRPLDDPVAALVLTPSEAASIAGDAGLTTAFFCTKESLYKALHPLTGIFLDFHDVEVELDPAAGRFSARVRLADWPPAAPREVEGRLRRTHGMILTVIELPSSA
jgi:4'-phosphopantetheinyl transferase EntD